MIDFTTFSANHRVAMTCSHHDKHRVPHTINGHPVVATGDPFAARVVATSQRRGDQG